MLSPLLWLSPAATDLLATVSKLLCGEVPCPPKKLAEVLKKADDAQCQGLLSDASIRSDLAAKLEGSKLAEVSDKTAGKLVELLGEVLQAKVKAIKAKAEPMVKGLAKKGMPELADLEALMPKGVEMPKALRFDYILWHGVGQKHSPKLLPSLKESVVHERLATAAFAGDGPLASCVIALHVLENLDAYVAWEASLSGSQPMTVCNEVHTPFDAKMAKEVAARRTLMNAISPDAASAAAEKVATGKPAKVLEDLAATACKDAIIPMYVAPPAPKEPKDKAAGKGKDKAEAAGKADAGGAKKAAGPQGSFGKMHQTTATQELQWALLNYQLRRGTTLGKAGAGGAGGAAAAARGKAAPQANGAASSSSKSKPAGFAGTWTPSGAGADLPPGHTPYSWCHAQAEGMKKGFVCTWTPHGLEKPPGHTDYSWENAIEGDVAVAAPSSSASKAKPAADKAKPAAAPKAAAGGGDAPAEGSIEADLCKLDLRCGKIVTCERAPGADTLYLLKVDVGDKEPRQVISSLVKHYKEDQLKDRQVVVYCNIKPGKLCGLDSQAMVLAATTGKGTDDEKCELLTPPKGTKEGTRAMAGQLEAGSLSETQSVKHISKVWGRVQPLLTTTDKAEATFNSIPLTMGKGPLSSGLKNAPIY